MITISLIYCAPSIVTLCFVFYRVETGKLGTVILHLVGYIPCRDSREYNMAERSIHAPQVRLYEALPTIFMFFLTMSCYRTEVDESIEQSSNLPLPAILIILT